MPYDLKTTKTPRLTGASLAAAVGLLEWTPTRALLAPGLLRDTGVAAFRRVHLTEAPSVLPALPRQSSAPAHPMAPPDLAALAQPSRAPGFRGETVADFAAAYAEGRSTPLQVTERLLGLLETDAAEQRAIVAWRRDDVIAQARAATARWQAGAPIGPFDGVPVAVKEELDVAGYATTAGTRFLREPATTDATVVARLRSQGALIVGKTNMHEIGIDTSGFNPHHGTPRNPWDPRRYTGGSSSGSAAAVAAGLCPVAVGADGGGSIRIPASLCGVVGLKATFSRISEAGAYPLCWSVGHVGPLAASVADLALAYAVMAGPDALDPRTLHQPTPRMDHSAEADLRGVRLGIFTPWLEDAQPGVVAAVRQALAGLQARGATLVEVEVPDLELCRIAHAVTILCEMATGLGPYLEPQRQAFGRGTRLNLALARMLTGTDYVRAQQARTRMTAHLERLFQQVDALITPTTACTAPLIRPDVMPHGESDITLTSALMRFAFLANLTGHPALSVPCGHDGDGLPVGLQLMGRPWEEHRLLTWAGAVEAAVERRTPPVHHRLLFA
jgi:Asp-tRNA(Asn)/Glu-tRNA(Gln) amidotransferase A subunit family amidase